MTTINYNGPIPLDAKTVDQAGTHETLRLQSGGIGRRKVFTTAPRTVSAQVMMSGEQVQEFELWFADSIDSGVRRFNMSMELDGGALLPYEVMITRPYTIDVLTTTLYKLSINLLVFKEL